MVSLLHFVSPLRLLTEALEPRQTSPVFVILGGVALICGVALLVAIRPRKSTG